MPLLTFSPNAVIMKLIFPRLCGAIPFLQGGCFYAEQMFAGGGALLLVLMLCLSLFAGALAENADAAATGETSKSKSATNLDSNYETTVTLSFPSAQVSLDSDVVFVLDKSTSAEAQDAALEMLGKLKDQLTGTSAHIKVAVVVFNKVAISSDWFDLVDDYDDIVDSFGWQKESGTNSHAGLLAAQKLLEDDTNVANDRKHLIFVSDGLTYIFGEEATSVAWNYLHADTSVPKIWKDPSVWGLKYGSQNPPADGWGSWLRSTESLVTKQGATYDWAYDDTDNAGTLTDANKYTEYANSVDKALYLTAKTYKECEKAGYHCYAVNTYANTAYPWGASFMNYLKTGETLSGDDLNALINNISTLSDDGKERNLNSEYIKTLFVPVEEEIVYLLGSGSTIDDMIGHTDDYHFELAKNSEGSVADSIWLTVGGKKYELDISPLGLQGPNETFIPMDGCFRFESKATKTIIKEDDSEAVVPLYIIDYFSSDEGGEIFMTVNTDVTNFQRVELSYKLKLTNPKTTAGTYGQYDQYGENGYDALYTNNSAVLYPKDSNGNEGEAEEFKKPTVSYTVYAPTETTPPSGDIDVPQTGDSTPLVLLAALMVLSAAGVAVILKRQRAHR